jgi:alkylation response protein AidB-like acyl-CoA dehydrogenase
MCAPTIVTHGSDEQKRRYLRPLFTGEEIWCQMFSEPGAGSDVASLSTRAVRDGDEWVLNGQKVWTTLAHVARYGIIIARTDPEQLKHKGLTMFVVDMQAPGVEVRPLVQATGEAEFNEVYFTDVRIPDAERLGDVGHGWSVSLTTLMNERVSIGGQVHPRGSGLIAVAMRMYADHASDVGPAARDELARLWIDAEVNRLTNIRASQARKQGTPGPEGSVGKLAMALLNQRIMNFSLDVMGADAMLYPSGYPMSRPTTAMDLSNPQKAFLRVQANSIEGGTTFIMKNILGERVLGLPGDIRVDKDRPWSEVPRS